MQLSDYTDLIPYPNNLQPLFMRWVEAMAEPGYSVQTVLSSFDTVFHIDTAVGSQLDVLGELLNRKRLVTFQPSGGLSPLLDDDIYRITLKAKVIQNVWKGTKQEIYDFWSMYFPQYPILIIDNQDMSMTVLVYGTPNDIGTAVMFAYDTNTSTLQGYDTGWWEPLTGILRSLILNHYFVPKPSGVKVKYEFIDTVAFGYDLNTAYFQGYEAGYWQG